VHQSFPPVDIYASSCDITYKCDNRVFYQMHIAELNKQSTTDTVLCQINYEIWSAREMMFLLSVLYSQFLIPSQKSRLTRIPYKESSQV
jgi:hypothetical protein